ncbi:hypothetical protein [Alteromonas sp. a30]|uniref:hypothetical protein n=1 Tax=Alteromonas sp. a30 TaxID=2730917 RepID=UPI00227FC58E|nr:hypothetical protein [Alteromonas sp. a30]MCY7296706.1 hypothetical protein [Alteromonas sp. a30]
MTKIESLLGASCYPTQYRYHAFGLNIQSDIPFPELLEQPANTQDSEADIQIVLSEKDSQINAPVSESKHFAINHNEALLKGDGFSLTVVDGKQITVHCNQIDQYRALIRLRILGAGIGLLLQQRGYLVLHGATVVGEKGAAVILGNSGDGKSTLCAQLVQRGYRLLGDDKCALRFDGKAIYALPSLPYIKLSKHVIEQLGFSLHETMPIGASHNKVYVNLSAAFEAKDVPMTTAIVLGRADQVSLSALTQMHTFDTFIQHSYRRQKLIGAGLHKTHFTQCHQMAQSITMSQYLRPLSEKGMSHLSPVFLKHIEELIGCGK